MFEVEGAVKITINVNSRSNESYAIRKEVKFEPKEIWT